MYVVVWEDAESDVDWNDEPVKLLEPTICTSIGMLVRDEPDRILIADSFIKGVGGADNVSNTIKIPRGMIVSMQEVDISVKTPRKKRAVKPPLVEPCNE